MDGWRCGVDVWVTYRSVSHVGSGHSRTVAVSSTGSWSAQIDGDYVAGDTFDATVDALAEVAANKACAVCGSGDIGAAEWMRENRADIMRRLGLTADGQVPGE